MQFESSKILSINSHENVIKIIDQKNPMNESIEKFYEFLAAKEISSVQFLSCNYKDHSEIICTAPQEVIESLVSVIKSSPFKIETTFATVTSTCTGTTSPKITKDILEQLKSENIQPESIWLSSMSITVLINKDKRQKAIQALHKLI